MVKALTASEARPRLARLLDLAATGQPVYLRRGGQLLRIAPVTRSKRAVHRPFGYFAFDDDLTGLANRATPSFTPLDED